MDRPDPRFVDIVEHDPLICLFYLRPDMLIELLRAQVEEANQGDRAPLYRQTAAPTIHSEQDRR